jgi:cyclophilin family peptidyl-prolyl cis-trans isomerase
MQFRNCYFLLIIFFASCAKPVAAFMADDIGKFAPAKILFKNASLKSERYIWNFGDGTTSQEFAPTHKYYTSGNYTVTLTAYKGNKKTTTAKLVKIDTPTDCLVDMETNLGSITIKLHESTPMHRDNFIKLAQNSFYEGTIFHRVISGFMIQGGDPDSKEAAKGQRLGVGGPGYTLPAEFIDGLVHIKGALCAARLGDQSNPKKESSGSQFYIVQGKPVQKNQLEMYEIEKGIKYSSEQKDIFALQGGTPVLDREYTIFGQVVEGMDIIDKIASTQTDAADRPVEDIKIIKLRIVK